MPIYQLDNGVLTPFERLRPGPELYESQVEELVWSDLEAFTGESMFPVARQARIAGGGVPDIIALDENARVVVLEIKRDIDRGQLAQCLEYAGWARLTNLDELAGLYDRQTGHHRGPEAFFRDWQDFTETTTPLTISPQPRLFLVARDFEGRTRSALDFLRENAVPVTVVPVTMYRNSDGGHILDIDSEHEPVLPTAAVPVPGRQSVLVDGRRVTVADLLAAGLLTVDEPVVFRRPRLGQSFTARVAADGSIVLEDGTRHSSPSGAAMRAADLVSYDGWLAWRVPRLDNVLLHELRQAYLTSSDPGPQAATPASQVADERIT